MFIVLKRNQILFWISSAIFMMSIFMGSWIHMDDLDNNELVSPTSLMNLYLNNVVACGFIASGIFCFGISTVIFLITNGLIIGFSLNQHLGTPIGEILFKILPHGVFEFPALLFAGMIGFRSLLLLVNIYRHSNLLKNSFYYFYKIQ